MTDINERGDDALSVHALRGSFQDGEHADMPSRSVSTSTDSDAAEPPAEILHDIGAVFDTGDRTSRRDRVRRQQAAADAGTGAPSHSWIEKGVGDAWGQRFVAEEVDACLLVAT